MVDGSADLGKIYVEVLEPAFGVTPFRSTDEFLHAVEGGRTFDLVVSEIEFAGASILAPERADVWRAYGRSPVLIVTHVDDVDAIRRILANGAQDCLTKPFNHNELIAKCLKLTAGTSVFECDAAGLRIRRSGEISPPLTANEFKLMSLLSRCDGGQIALDALAEGVWGQKVSDQRIHTMLSRLRPKMQPLNLRLEVTRNRTVVLHADG